MPVVVSPHRPPAPRRPSRRAAGRPRPPEAETPGQALLTWALGVFGPAVIWCGAAVAVGLALPADPPDGQCEGIGFGCTLSPRDTLWFAAVYVGALAVPIGTLVSIVAAVLAPEGRRRAAVVGALSAMAAVIAGLAVLLVTVDGGTA